MKILSPYINRLFIFCIVCLIITSAPGLAFSQEKIILASGEWLPFQSENLKHGGVVSHVVTDAFRNANVEVELVYLPWKRAYEMAKRGDLAGTFVWSKKPDRIKYFLFSDIVVQDLPVLFYRKEHPVKWTPGEWTSLKEKSIGATIGYTYLADFHKYEESGELSVQRVTSDELNFRKLMMGRIDAFPASLETGYALLQTMFSPEEIEKLTYVPQMPPNYQPTSFHLLLSKNFPDADTLIKKFNQGLSELKQSGDYDQYLEASRNGSYK